MVAICLGCINSRHAGCPIVMDRGSNQRQTYVWWERGGSVRAITQRLFIHHASEPTDEGCPVPSSLAFHWTIWHLQHTHTHTLPFWIVTFLHTEVDTARKQQKKRERESYRDDRALHNEGSEWRTQHVRNKRHEPSVRSRKSSLRPVSAARAVQGIRNLSCSRWHQDYTGEPGLIYVRNICL